MFRYSTWNVNLFKGAGGLRSILTFWLILIEENASYQKFFSKWKILLLAKVIAFSNFENIYNCIARTKINPHFPENQI